MAINIMKMALDPAAMAKAAAEIAAQLVQNVPDEMKATANWVNFELVPNPKAHSGFDKVPINPKNGNKAQSNNPDTWGTFGQACDRLKAQPGAVHGVGLMLGHSRFAGFDDDEIYAKLLDDQIKEDVNAGRLPKNTDLKEIHKKVKADGGYNGLTIAEMSAKALESGNFYGADLVKEFNSYTEVSPSGNGLHVYFVGKLPPSGRKKEYFEMYEDGRFLTVTGEPYKEFKAMNAPTAEVITKYHEKYITKGIYDKKKTSTAPPPPKPTMSSRPAVLDDNQIITRAMRNPKFAALWAGNISGYPSQSEADLALCELLAFWTGGDAEQMDRLFRQSGLYRENKWDRSQSGTTYGAITINKAIDLCPQYYDPNYYSNSSGFNVNIKSPGSTPISIDGTTAPAEFVAYNWDGTPEAPAGAAADQQNQKPAFGLVPFSAIKPQSVNWLWFPYIPRGKITLLTADPGTGKTFFALYLAACVSTGKPFWTDDRPYRQPENAIYQTAEDGYADTIVPRIMSMNCDRRHVFMINEETQGLSLKDSVDYIESVMKDTRPALLIFDPLQAYLGADVNMNAANEVRPVLSRIAKLADTYDTAVIFIMHLSKMSSVSKALYRALGSIDIPGASRSMLTMGKDPQDDSRRIICHEKSSLARNGQSLAFKIDPENGGVIFDGFSDLTANELLGGCGKREKPADALNKACDEILNLLGEEGYTEFKDIKKQAEIAGITRATLYRAKDELMLNHVTVGYGKNKKSYWISGDIDKDEFKKARQAEPAVTEQTAPEQSEQINPTAPPTEPPADSQPDDEPPPIWETELF